MDTTAIIAKKRDGHELSRDEITHIAQGAARSSIPDYQLAAWLMAVFLKGMTLRETSDLTTAMAESGERLDLGGLPKPWLDKHSTGGVGDKTTIVVLPIFAAAGVTMVKMSGRGLGITGGTVDKLESVPGMRMDLTPEEIKDQASRIGIALTGQTPRLAPADKALYALRDVTATVNCQPLIVSSILSKKIAGGAEWVSFDVKCGSGSFMPDFASARALAEGLTSVGESSGLKVLTHVTDMDQPLGRSAGNALEVKEALRVLAGEQGRFTDLCTQLVDDTLEALGQERQASRLIASGRAIEKAMEWFGAQSADLAVFGSESWQTAPCQTMVVSAKTGSLSRVDARVVGEVVVGLGGGRREKGDTIDPSVGVETLVEVGSQVELGQPLFKVHSADAESGRSAASLLQEAVQTSPDPVSASPVVLA